MAWWNPIAKFGGLLAAPFTGGASLLPSIIAGGASAAAGYGLSKLGGGGKGDQPKANAEDPYRNILSQAAQSKQATGTALEQQGQSAIEPALQYLKSLLSPTGAMDASREMRGRVIDQYDTARRAAANFGPRGGGTTSALATSRFDQAESLADITSSATRDASGSLASLGLNLAGLGLSAEQLASEDLTTVINAVMAREKLNVERRGQNLALAGDVGETLGTIIGAVLTRDKK